MLNTNNLSLSELEKQIAHFEERLMDFIIDEDQVEFIKEILTELRTAKNNCFH
jgi:hypothetical protein